MSPSDPADFSSRQIALIEQLVRDALAFPPAERERFVHAGCAGDQAVLRAVLERLDEASAGATDVTRDSAAERPTSASGRGSISDAETIAATPSEGIGAAAEKPGTVIGRYKLIKPLGEGGFGAVYLAEQEQPVRREVALKIIKLGMDTRQFIARFEAERQALALMDHPNIAKVLDAGATAAGRPFLVMELVHGIPITDYCDNHRLSFRDRLKLFVQVCGAVQHAHQKGIIHRDIKPSNVLVTRVDGRPVPKVIDFGIAKATEQRLTEQTMFTEFGQFIGTPAYMSPEQADAGGVDIDTRSDIYSLGVLLYELLTGATPFDARSLRRAALDEIKRIIREDEPSKPSTRLSTQTDDLASIAERRGVEPKRLGLALRGDLDWIIMKALEKDRARRYETANGFAADIDRYLKDEPVTASPPSAAYRLRKLIRRNKQAFAVTAVVAVLLTFGSIGTAVGFVRATYAEGRALQAAESAERARAQEAAQRRLADEQTVKARAERDKAERVTKFLTDMLAGVAPSVAQGRDTTLLREIMGRTAERVGAELADQPEVEAAIRSHLGVTFLQIRALEPAEENLERALALYQRINPEDNDDTASSLNNLGEARQFQERYAEAEELMRAGVAMRRRLVSGDDPDLAWSITDLGNLLVDMDQYEEGEALLLEAMEMNRRMFGDNHEDVAVGLNSLGNLKHYLGALDEAEAYYRRALAAHEATLSARHPYVVTDMHNIAHLLKSKGQREAAIDLFRQALGRGRETYPDGHEQIGSCLTSLAELLETDATRVEEAEAMLREALAVYRRIDGDVSRSVGLAAWRLGRSLEDQRKSEAAQAVFEESLAVNRAIHGPDDPSVAVALQCLARVRGKLGAADEAAALYDDALTIQRKQLGDEHREVGITLWNIAVLHENNGDLAAAERTIREAARVLAVALGEEHRDTARCYERLGRILRGQGKSAEAEAELRRALAIHEATSGPDSVNAIGAAYELGKTLAGAGHYDEAETLYQRGLAAPEFVLPARNRAEIRSHYAILLVTRERFAEGVEHMESAVATYMESDGLHAPVTATAIRRLAKAYDRWHAAAPDQGHEAKAAEWRSKLERAGDGDNGVEPE